MKKQDFPNVLESWTCPICRAKKTNVNLVCWRCALAGKEIGNPEAELEIRRVDDLLAMERRR